MTEQLDRSANVDEAINAIKKIGNVKYYNSRVEDCGPLRDNLDASYEKILDVLISIRNEHRLVDYIKQRLTSIEQYIKYNPDEPRIKLQAKADILRSLIEFYDTLEERI